MVWILLERLKEKTKKTRFCSYKLDLGSIRKTEKFPDRRLFEVSINIFRTAHNFVRSVLSECFSALERFLQAHWKMWPQNSDRKNDITSVEGALICLLIFRPKNSNFHEFLCRGSYERKKNKHQLTNYKQQHAYAH